MTVVQEELDREKLDRRDTKALQVFDRRLGGESSVCAPSLLGHGGVARGKPLDVYFVDERLVPWRSGRAIVSPGEGGVENHGQRGERRAVAIVERQVGVRIAEAIAPQRVVPLQVAADGLGVGVEQHLVRVEPMAAGGLVWAVDPISVELPGFGVG
jgi:hypothetical protein